MIPTPDNIKKMNSSKRKSKPVVHQKISNSFIENSIFKNNFSSLKTIYYLSTILQDLDLESKDDKSLITIRIDKREMLKFTNLSASTIVKTVQRMQETSITFYDEDKNIKAGVSLLPRYEFIAGKNIVELKIFVEIAKLIVDVKRKYTNINIKSLMSVKNMHSLRLLALLNRISQYDDDIPKRKHLTLDELNYFFGTNYKTWSTIEREIIKPIQEDLNNASEFSFVYESNFEALGRGRPKFKDVTIDLIKNKVRQRKLF